MEAVMDRKVVNNITTHFQALSAFVPLHPIRTKAEYDKAVSVLNQLLDAGASDENHPLANLAETIGELIGDYDDAHYPLGEVSASAMLRFLMAQHDLKQSDLSEIGTQGVVSEILNDKRELNVRQIKALSVRFQVNPAVFL
ncbi:MAG: transcriptional regulator [Methylobacillus sp.]|jgi:HTH-type transcriptional regulator/antitoxin HigA|nr:transcriptional regulator [Methylobacillus sp.]